MEFAILTSPAREAGRILNAIQRDGQARLESDLERVRAARRARPWASGGEDERWDLLEGILERIRSIEVSGGECPDACVRLLKHLSRPAAGPPESSGSQACCSLRPPIRNAFLLPALTT